MSGCRIFTSVVLAYAVSTALASSYTCNDCALARIPASIPPETTHLYLKGNRMRTVARSSLVGLKNVRLLDVSGNRLNNIELDSFTGLRITKLVLSFNELAIVPHIEPLANSLTSLDLRSNLITTIEPHTFKNFTKLKFLYFTANSITALDEFSLHAPLTRLHKVCIDGNPLDTLNSRAFAGMQADNLILNYNVVTEFPCLNDIILLYHLNLYGNPISTVPTGCGQWWSKLLTLDLGQTKLTSLDNITKYTPRLSSVRAHGVPLVLSNNTFRNTPNLKWVYLKDVNHFPQFHASKSMLETIHIEGKSLRCIEEEHLDGMTAVTTFKLWHTSVDLLPHPGCSNTSYENRTANGYFQSLQNISIYQSKLEHIPSLHRASQLFSMRLRYNSISMINGSEIPELRHLYEWNLYYGKILHFPNLTILGYDSSLTMLQLSKNKISSIPCFHDNFKLYNLAKIVIHHNLINYICNMDFAPNIKSLDLTYNLLIGKFFVQPSNGPLHNLHTISARFNNIDQIYDSDFLVIQSCQELHMGWNGINQFPNIKLIASTAINIELLHNVIPDVPCNALDNMGELATLHLDDNIISFVCPLLLNLAPKLIHLGLSRNRLLEISDLRLPVRIKPTRVLLDGNPFRCLTTLCWMLFVPEDGHLQLELGDTNCTDDENAMKNIFTGIAAECRCKVTDQLISD